MTTDTILTEFDQYYTYEQMTSWLKTAADLYPKLSRLTTIGESHGGRPIWLMEITNTRTGDYADKPAYYVEANIHASEVCGEVVCRWLIWHLLTAYRSDSAVRDLLTERTFYVLPRIAVDGADVVLTTPERLRSSIRPYPYEEEQPGLRSEDIDGDGRIMTMRLEDPCGSWTVSELDDRLMVKREPDGDGGTYYRLLPEGRLHDWDGHGIAMAPSKWGLDMNRNWPHDWAVEGEQSGAGPMPLSEPETRAVADFIVGHPNICGVQSLHLMSGAILRPYCAKDDDTLPTPDLEVYQALGKRGTELTDYPCVSIYHDFRYEPKRFIRGGFLDWIYEDLGVFAFSTELWDAFKTAGIEERDFIKFLGYERKPEEEMKLLEWSDAELDGAGFIRWKEYDHPQLGAVEIGGWDFWAVWSSPPPQFRADIAERNARFAIAHAKASPLVRIDDLASDKLAADVYRVSCTVRNYGFLSTAISTKAMERKLVRPMRAEISVPRGCELTSGTSRVEIGQLQGRSNKLRQSFGGAEGTDNERYIEWVVRGPAGKRVTVTVVGQRTGKQTATVKLA